MDQNKNIDYSKIPPDLQEKLIKWEANSPTGQQLQTLKDIEQIVEGLTVELAKSQDRGDETVAKFGALLTDIRSTLTSIEGKEAPESPDYATPVVEAVKGLEKALTTSLGAIELKPELNPNISVQPTPVHVDAPKVDLKGIEKALGAMPAAFESAIKLIPETPETNLDPIIKQLKTMTDWLKSIDTASRLKANGPGAGSASAVTNDGTFATPARQDTGNASLASIDTKTPSLGQALAASSSPVVLTAAQVTTLTPQTNALTDTQLRATAVPVSGTVTATPTGTQDSNTKQVNGVTVNVGIGTASTGTQRVAVSSDSFPATQPVSAASLPLPSGASTAGNQTTGNSSLSSIDSKLSGTITVDDVGPTTIVAFVTPVTTAGTRVQLTNVAVEAGVLQAPSTNSGIIYVGGSNVSSSVYGAELQAGQATGIAIDNTNKIYIDASVNGDKCAFLGG